jgi:hypothetical protein
MPPPPEIGTPQIPATVEPGADVVFIGCGHEEPCPEVARPCSVALYGPMELMQIRADGWLVAAPEDVDDPRQWPLFQPYELSTPEAVAAYVARVLDEPAATDG